MSTPWYQKLIVTSPGTYSIVQMYVDTLGVNIKLSTNMPKLGFNSLF